MENIDRVTLDLLALAVPFHRNDLPDLSNTQYNNTVARLSTRGLRAALKHCDAIDGRFALRMVVEGRVTEAQNAAGHRETVEMIGDGSEYSLVIANQCCLANVFSSGSRRLPNRICRQPLRDVCH